MSDTSSEAVSAPENAGLKRGVTDDERAAFDRDGVVALRGIYPDGWLAYLERQLDDIFFHQADRRMDQRSPTGDRTDGNRADMAAIAVGLRTKQPGAAVALDGPATEVTGRSIVETDAAHWHNGMRHHHLAGPLPALVADLVGAAKINFYCDQLFLKEPGSLVRTPFHQDEPYFLVNGQVAVCWVPVDTVAADNGPMGYVRGSHRWGKLFKPSDFVTDTGTFPERDGIDHSALDTLPPISADTHDLVYIEAEPGDVIVHHWSTVHGAAGNVSANRIRRAASIRYAWGDSTFYRRPSSPEPFRDTVELRDGEPLEAAGRFPVVWPQR